MGYDLGKSPFGFREQPGHTQKSLKAAGLQTEIGVPQATWRLVGVGTELGWRQDDASCFTQRNSRQFRS